MEKIVALFHEVYGSTILFKKENKLAEVLACLEETEGFEPRYYGLDEESKLPYTREGALKFCYSHEDPVIWGKSTLLRYELELSIGEGFDVWLNMSADKLFSKEAMPRFFALGAYMVDICQPIWSSTDYCTEAIWAGNCYEVEEGQPELNKQKQLMHWMASGSDLGYSGLWGFSGLGMVSYMIEDIAEGFGLDYLKSAPALVQELPNGLVRIALCEKPWEEEWNSLLEKWVNVMMYLAGSGFVAYPHVDLSSNKVAFMISQNGLIFKEKMRQKYQTLKQPIPECFARRTIDLYDLMENERITSLPPLIKVPDQEKSEQAALAQMKNEGFI